MSGLLAFGERKRRRGEEMGDVIRLDPRLLYDTILREQMLGRCCSVT